MFMKLDKAHIFYEEAGEGFPIIFIHGFHIDHKCLYIPVEKHTGDLSGFRRIYVDLPGMGKTKLKERVDSTDEIFIILLQFIDRITEGKPFAVAGYSYGGYLARGVLKARRKLLKGMFLHCPVIIPDYAVRILPDFSVFEVDENFVGTLEAEEREFFTESSVIQTEEVYNRFREEIYEPFLLADRSMMKNLKRYAYAFDQPVDNQGLDFDGPVQFLAGHQDSVVGYEDIYSIFNDYPSGELTILNRAGHNLQIERPEDFAAVFMRWLGLVKEYSA